MTSPKMLSCRGNAAAGKPYLEISPDAVEKRSVWLLLLFVAEAYTSSVLQHFEEARIGHRAGLLYSAAHRHRRQQRNADHLDAGALDGAGEVRLRDMGRVIRKEVSTSFLIALTLGLAGCLRAG